MLKSWLIKCVKTPVATVLKTEDSLDYTDTLLEAIRKPRFMALQIRVNTIFNNLILNANEKDFQKPLITFMNTFMKEGGFAPYDFFSEFERDTFQFDSSDALMNFGPKQKVIF